MYLKQGQTFAPLSGSNCTHDQIHYTVPSKLDELKHGRLNITLQHQVVHHVGKLKSKYIILSNENMLKEDECIWGSFIAEMLPSTICNITTIIVSIYSGQWLGHISSDIIVGICLSLSSWYITVKLTLHYLM